jgi:hypothetical protein
VVDAQPLEGCTLRLSSRSGAIQATSLVSLLVASWPPSMRVVKQIEHCWRTSPSS